VEASSESGSSGLTARFENGRWLVPCAVSTAVHLAVLAAIAVVWCSLPTPPADELLSLLAIDSTLEELDTQRFTETPELLPVPATETVTLPSGGAAAAVVQAALSAESLAPADQSAMLTASAAWQSWMTADMSAAAELGAPRLGAGSGTGTGVGADGGDSFFGLSPQGRRFVYVLDCSRSMNHPHNTEAKTRFKRMKLELVRSVGGLSSEMEFFLIFFNDFPIGMPAPAPVLATSRVQHHYLQWMSTLKAHGHTDPLAALQIALRMRPDVIFFLTDGSFSYRVEHGILGLRTGRTKINTFVFEDPMTPDMRRAFELLQQKKGARARQQVETKKEFEKVVAAWKAHRFLQNMAKRHNGTFQVIPDNG
jgi:hypothetical protein